MASIWKLEIALREIHKAQGVMQSGKVCRELSDGGKLHWPRDTGTVNDALQSAEEHIREEIGRAHERNARAKLRREQAKAGNVVRLRGAK